VKGEPFTKAQKKWHDDVWTKWGEFVQDQTCEPFKKDSLLSQPLIGSQANSRIMRMGQMMTQM
jgi:hypothetical protein